MISPFETYHANLTYDPRQQMTQHWRRDYNVSRSSALNNGYSDLLLCSSITVIYKCLKIAAPPTAISLFCNVFDIIACCYVKPRSKLLYNIVTLFASAVTIYSSGLAVARAPDCDIINKACGSVDHLSAFSVTYTALAYVILRCVTYYINTPDIIDHKRVNRKTNLFQLPVSPARFLIKTLFRRNPIIQGEKRRLTVVLWHVFCYPQRLVLFVK